MTYADFPQEHPELPAVQMLRDDQDHAADGRTPLALLLAVPPNVVLERIAHTFASRPNGRFADRFQRSKLLHSRRHKPPGRTEVIRNA